VNPRLFIITQYSAKFIYNSNRISILQNKAYNIIIFHTIQSIEYLP